MRGGRAEVEFQKVIFWAFILVPVLSFSAGIIWKYTPIFLLGTASGGKTDFLSFFKSFAPIGGNLFVPPLLPQWLVVSSCCCRPPIDPQLGTRQTTIQPCWKFRKNLPTHFPEGFLRAGNAQLDCASKTGLSSYFSFVIVFNPEHNTTLVGRHFWPLVIAFDDKKFRLHIWEFGRPMARRCRFWISSLQNLTVKCFELSIFLWYFSEKINVAEAWKARMAYKYQPIKDEMFVSDDEAVSNQKSLPIKSTH